MTVDILFEEITGKYAQIGLITLARPQVLNALNHAMFLALEKKLLEWKNNSKIKAVLIQAVPGRAFCAGGDIRHAYELGKKQDPHLVQFFRDEYRVNQLIYHYPKPYIALLDGITMGGGAGVSVHGSLRIGTENLIFAMPETNIGFFPDIGASYFLSRLPYKMGFYLGITGAQISAADCLALGIVDVLVRQDTVPLLMANIYETKETKDIQHILQTLSINAETSLLMKHKDEIETSFRKNSIEEIIITLEGYPSAWCKETAAAIKLKSPTSLKVTLRELQKGCTLEFNACMQMEDHLMRHFIRGHDFYEGVRAAIIDKDQSPHWQPVLLEDVSEAMVEDYFK